MTKPPVVVDDLGSPDAEDLAKALTPLLRPDKVEQGQQIVATMYRQVVHQGPLPPPETLAGYEHTLSGAAERIMAMAEKEQTHRHAQEHAMVRGEYLSRYIGQFGAISAIVILAALVAYSLYTGQPIAAGVITAIGVAAGYFLMQSRKPSPEPAPQKQQPAKRSRRKQK